jgi:nucleotide-binding universal stress UspA family protein
MFEKILVTIDRSAFSKTVFQKGLFLAKNLRANLMLLQVKTNLMLSHDLSPQEEKVSNFLDSTRTLGNSGYYSGEDINAIQECDRQWHTYQEQSLNFLRDLAEEAIGQGVETEFSQNAGNPAITICEVASNWDADLIVIGRQSHSSLNELLLDSVSNYVLHHAPCSVLVVDCHGVARSSTYSRERRS